MLRLMLLFALLGLAFVPAIAQETPAPAPQVKDYASFDALFDDFDKRRAVLLTRMERMEGRDNVDPADLRKAEKELIELDTEFALALRRYIDQKPLAADLMGARFELTLTLSRLDDRLADAIAAANEFLKNHDDAPLAPEIRFVRGQTLFRVPGKEAEALNALEQFIEKHPDRQGADAARMMRIRTLLFMDRVADAKRALDTLLQSPKVKDDAEAKAHLEAQLTALDWVGREIPAFRLTDTEGGALNSDEMRGKVFLLYVWDSTSSACLGEMPFVQELHKRHGEKISVVGISVNESRAALEQFLKRNTDTIKFRSAWIDRDEEGSLIKRLNVSLIPFNVLVDANGKVYRYDVRSDDLLRYGAKLAQ